MTIAFYENRARHPLSTATLVLVDVCRGSLPGRQPAPLTTPETLARCHEALLAARRVGVPVVFVHDQPGDAANLPPGQSRWFAGFEPRRYESVVARSAHSCYASPYFSEILDGAGRSMLLAGLLGLEAAGATAADALRHGHRLTLLSDAVGFDSATLIRDSHRGADPHARQGSRARKGRPALHAVTTGDWLAELTPLLPSPRAMQWQGGGPVRRLSRIQG